MKAKFNKGFTLIEILVVIGIIALLAAVVIVAINPARQFAQARNSQRESNINTLLNGIGQNLADHKGVLNGCTIGSATSTIGTDTAGSDAPYVDMTTCMSAYIPAGIPMDPKTGTAGDTRYQVSYDSSTGRYMVCAPDAAEAAISGSGPICVTR